MSTLISPGSIVRLQALDGEIVRRVVKDCGDVLLVCRESEWKRAQRQKRAPLAVGFKWDYLLGVEPRATLGELYGIAP